MLVSLKSIIVSTRALRNRLIVRTGEVNVKFTCKERGKARGIKQEVNVEFTEGRKEGENEAYPCKNNDRKPE
jgi:hypothetical protein